MFQSYVIFVDSFVMSMFICVCLSTHISRKPHIESLPILCKLHIAMAQSSSNGILIHYVCLE